MLILTIVKQPRQSEKKSNALIALHETDEATYKIMDGEVDLYLEEGNLLLGENKPLKLCVYHSPGARDPLLA